VPIKIGVTNLERGKEIAGILHLPEWLVEALIVEYLPCRRFLEADTSILLDFGHITVQDVKAIASPYITLSNISLIHNVKSQTMRERMAHGIAGLPLSTLAEHPHVTIPEGKVSPSYIPFIYNSLDVVDWKLDLNNFALVYNKEAGELFQWNLITLPMDTTESLADFDPSLVGYNPAIFTREQHEALRSIRQAIFNTFSQQPNSSDGISLSHMRDSLKRSYEDLETLRASMRSAVLTYHEQHKGRREAKQGYTEEAPPLLTVFDQIALVKGDKSSSKGLTFKVRTFIEPLFFRSAYRAFLRAANARAKVNAGEINSTFIAEEIEAAAESITFSIMCLEAYINGFVEDYLDKWTDHVKRMELKAKWLMVPAILGKPDCFDTGSQPFQDFTTLVRWRNDDLTHYKHEFHSPESLGKLGKVSKLYAICNADNSQMAIATVRKMIQRLNEFIGFVVPTWIQETSGSVNWLTPGEI